MLALSLQREETEAYHRPTHTELEGGRAGVRFPARELHSPLHWRKLKNKNKDKESPAKQIILAGSCCRQTVRPAIKREKQVVESIPALRRRNRGYRRVSSKE